jgi:hypothetical protein
VRSPCGGRNAELGIEGGRDRVRLDRVSDAEGRRDGRHREEDGERPSEPTADALRQVDLRSSGVLPGRVHTPEVHAEERLGVLRRHAEHAGDPHPEQRARPAEVDGGRDARDVPHADGRRECDRQGLVVRDLAACARLAPSDDRQPQGIGEPTKLQSPKDEGEVEARDEQDRDEQERSPHEGRDRVEALLHGITLLRARLIVRSQVYGSVYGMEKTTVYLTSEQKRALERAARSSGRSEADLIREGVDTVTRTTGARELRLPLFESGHPDLAERVDEALEGFGEG